MIVTSMKHAFLITAYNYPDLLVDLINTLITDDSCVFVHLEKKAHFSLSELFPEIVKPEHLKMAPRRLNVRWGGYSYLAAVLFLLRAAVNEQHFDYYHLLSGQCYPVKSMEEIFKFFEENDGKEFIESFPLPTSRWEGGGLNRMIYFHLYDYINAQKRIFSGKLNYRLIRLFVQLQKILRLRRKLPGNYPVYYGGSAFWSLSGKCISYIVDILDNTPTIEVGFRFTFCAEELLFQTLIANSPFSDFVAGSNLRYIDWQMRNGNIPANLDDTDFEKILLSEAIIARKFHPFYSANLKRRLQEYAGRRHN
jgi:hypothetical protein